MLWKKSKKKSWQGDEACPLIKQERRKRMDIEGEIPEKNFDHQIPLSSLNQYGVARRLFKILYISSTFTNINVPFINSIS